MRHRCEKYGVESRSLIPALQNFFQRYANVAKAEASDCAAIRDYCTHIDLQSVEIFFRF